MMNNLSNKQTLTSEQSNANEDAFLRYISQKINDLKQTDNGNVIAQLSHEIRTPINGIYGALQILRDQPDHLNAVHLLERSIESTERLIDVVDKLLGSQWVIKPQNTAVHSRSQSSSPPDFKDKTILVAEDNEINRLILENMLQHTGATVIFACDGQEAIDAFGQYQFDAVLLDINMPNVCGIEACIRIKELCKQIPILAISANMQRTDIEKYTVSGFDGFAGKPLNIQVLYNTLGQHLIH